MPAISGDATMASIASPLMVKGVMEVASFAENKPSEFRSSNSATQSVTAKVLDVAVRVAAKPTVAVDSDKHAAAACVLSLIGIVPS